MSFIIYNGSPRGKNSNSSVISSWFTQGFSEKDPAIRYLNKAAHHDEYAREMAGYDSVLFVFPLYVDGMPGQVKNFFECLYPYRQQLRGKKVTWIIHSGFNEAIHSRSLERYLSRFSDRMGFSNHGVIILPGSEGFRLYPANMMGKKSQAVAELAKAFEAGKPYDESLLKLLCGYEKMGMGRALALAIGSKLGLSNIYWNMVLKQNNAYKNRFAAPYAQGPTPITSPSAISKPAVAGRKP